MKRLTKWFDRWIEFIEDAYLVVMAGCILGLVLLGILGVLS